MTQDELTERATIKYADEVIEANPNLANNEGELRRVIWAAYLSGVLATSEVLSIHDGVHPSKLAESARRVGTELLGVKPKKIT